jgi:GT2 family glycosyltransferase
VTPGDHSSDLTVIIVTYDGAGVIEACLDSIFDQGEDLEVIVVDNASTDDTVRIIYDRFPSVKLITADGNRGFGGGCRLGVAASDREYFLLLNQDAVVRGPLSPLVRNLERDPEVAVLGGRVSYPGGGLQYTIGREVTPLRLLLSWIVPIGIPWLGKLCARVETRTGDYERERRDIPWVSGAFFLSRRTVWEELGGMDSAYFMYLEDVDYCRRARDAGYLVGFSPSTHAVHAERSGQAHVDERALRWTAQSYDIYLRKHRGPRIAKRFGLALGIVFLVEGILLRLASACPWWRSRSAQARAILNLGRRLVLGPSLREYGEAS